MKKELNKILVKKIEDIKEEIQNLDGKNISGIKKFKVNRKYKIFANYMFLNKKNIFLNIYVNNRLRKELLYNGEEWKEKKS